MARILVTGYLTPTPKFPISNLKIKIWMQDTGCTMQDKNGSDSGHRVPGTWYLTPTPHSPHFKS
jgi:hypothetical protein